MLGRGGSVACPSFDVRLELTQAEGGVTHPHLGYLPCKFLIYFRARCVCRCNVNSASRDLEKHRAGGPPRPPRAAARGPMQLSGPHAPPPGAA